MLLSVCAGMVPVPPEMYPDKLLPDDADQLNVVPGVFEVGKIAALVP